MSDDRDYEDELTQAVTVHFSDIEHDLIQAIANYRGEGIEEFVRGIMIDALESIAGLDDDGDEEFEEDFAEE